MLAEERAPPLTDEEFRARFGGLGRSEVDEQIQQEQQAGGVSPALHRANQILSDLIGTKVRAGSVDGIERIMGKIAKEHGRLVGLKAWKSVIQRQRNRIVYAYPDDDLGLHGSLSIDFGYGPYRIVVKEARLMSRAEHLIRDNMNKEFVRLQRQYGRSFNDKYENLRDYVAEIRANLRDHSQHDAEVLDNTPPVPFVDFSRSRSQSPGGPGDDPSSSSSAVTPSATPSVSSARGPALGRGRGIAFGRGRGVPQHIQNTAVQALHGQYHYQPMLPFERTYAHAGIMNNHGNERAHMGRAHLIRPSMHAGPHHFMHEIQADANMGMRSLESNARRGPFSNMEGSYRTMARSAKVVYKVRNKVIQITVQRGVHRTELDVLIGKLGAHRMSTSDTEIYIIANRKKTKLGLLSRISLGDLRRTIQKNLVKFRTVGIALHDRKPGALHRQHRPNYEYTARY
jgi:hypothetical protein